MKWNLGLSESWIAFSYAAWKALSCSLYLILVLPYLPSVWQGDEVDTFCHPSTWLLQGLIICFPYHDENIGDYIVYSTGRHAYLSSWWQEGRKSDMYHWGSHNSLVWWSIAAIQWPGTCGCHVMTLTAGMMGYVVSKSSEQERSGCHWAGSPHTRVNLLGIESHVLFFQSMALGLCAVLIFLSLHNKIAGCVVAVVYGDLLMFGDIGPRLGAWLPDHVCIFTVSRTLFASKQDPIRFKACS